MGGSGGGGSGGTGATGGSGSGGRSPATLHCELDEGSLSVGCDCIDDPNGAFGGSTATECSKASLGGSTICCADLEYPEADQCHCKKWGCYEGPSNCNCGFTEPEGIPECVNSYPVCCAQVNLGQVYGCQCAQFITECSSTEVQVPNCGFSIASCFSDQLEVDSCTP